MFGIGADLDAEQAPALVEAVLREVEALRREPVGAEELEKARRNFLAAKAWEQESVAGMARKLGSSQLLTGDPGFEDAYLARVRGATQSDLLRVAREWLVPERQSLALVAPTGTAPAEAELRAGLARGAEGAARRFATPARGASHGPSTHVYTIGAGVRLLVQPRREIPVVAARAALLGGQLVESEATAGLTSFTTSLWMRGTQAHGAAEFARRVESLAADVDSFAGRSSCGVTLDCPSESFEDVLALFADALLTPAFGEEEIERERRDTLAALARREDRLGVRAFDLFASAHWERHPYRLPTSRDARDGHALRARGAAGAPRAAGARRQPGDRAGRRRGPGPAAALVQRRFAELAGGSRVEASLPPLEPAPRSVRSAVEHKDRAQAHLVIGFRGLDVHDPERHALEVLCQILSGQGGRLFLELRDRQSLAYSVGATNIEGLAPGFFAVAIATAPEKLDEAQSGILSELRRVLDGPPPAAELERARRYLLGSFAIDRQRSSTRALQLALDTRYGLHGDFDLDYPERIRAVSAEDVLRVARRVLDLDAYTLAAIRP